MRGERAALIRILVRRISPMASRTTVTLVDDLDGTEAEQSVSFGLEGVNYEIDLSRVHAQALRDALAPYTAAARRTGGRRASRGQAPLRTASNGNGSPLRSRSASAEIRAWAVGHGVTLAERGRIPARIIEAFEAGDPTKLPTNGAAASSTAAPEPADVEPAAPAGVSSAGDDEPRGRDGLTATQRETIRAWALEQGIEVKTRGQLKKELISNYRAWESRPR
jgi:Lsr2